jgi:hypothetical protein
MEPAERREILLGGCAPALLDVARFLTLYIDDDLACVPSPSPMTERMRPFVAAVSLWIADMSGVEKIESILIDAGFDVAGYQVAEHLYTEYGGNAHSSPRDWPDGQRSPGLTTVTPLERLWGVSREKWMRHWFNRQGPMSEAMQPRSRYVRNVVLDVLTPGAAAYEGIVMESWPSAGHLTNPMTFYGARSRVELVRNMVIMLQSVAAFLPIWRIMSVTTSEYFVCSPEGRTSDCTGRSAS